MKKRYWLIKRREIYYLTDSETNRKESLGTRDRQEAESLLKARLDGVNQSHMNLAMARAYLSSQDEKMTKRTWGDVIDRYCQTGKASTRERAGRAFASKDFAVIRKRKLVGTTGDDFLAVLDRGGAATNHFLRRLHNLALGMGWLTGPVLLRFTVITEIGACFFQGEHGGVLKLSLNSVGKFGGFHLWPPICNLGPCKGYIPSPCPLSYTELRRPIGKLSLKRPARPVPSAILYIVMAPIRVGSPVRWGR